MLEAVKARGGMRPDQITIVSYDVFSRRVPGHDRLWLEHKFLILDESHSVKNAEAQRTKSLMPVAQAARHRILISGTPLQGNPIDLYTQVPPLPLLPPYLPTSSPHQAGLIAGNSPSNLPIVQPGPPFQWMMRSSPVQAPPPLPPPAPSSSSIFGTFLLGILLMNAFPPPPHLPPTPHVWRPLSEQEVFIRTCLWICRCTVSTLQNHKLSRGAAD